MAEFRGWAAFVLVAALVLVVLVFVLNVLIMLIPVVIIAALILWFLSLLARKRRKPIVRVWMKKF